MDVVVVNRVGLPADEVVAGIAAWQIYNDHWLVPFYPEMAGRVFRLGEPGDYPLIVIAPNTTQAGSLGFHTTSQGVASAVVEMDACRKYGVDWQTVGSHEAGEMGRNPTLSRFVTWGSRLYPEEIADPVTSSKFPITVGSTRVWVSNAVTAAYWNPDAPPGSRFDLMGEVTASIAGGIPKGGWMEWQEAGAWDNAWGPEIAPEMVAFMLTRQGRRHRMKHDAARMVPRF